MSNKISLSGNSCNMAVRRGGRREMNMPGHLLPCESQRVELQLVFTQHCSNVGPASPCTTFEQRWDNVLHLHGQCCSSVSNKEKNVV